MDQSGPQQVAKSPPYGQPGPQYYNSAMPNGQPPRPGFMTQPPGMSQPPINGMSQQSFPSGPPLQQQNKAPSMLSNFPPRPGVFMPQTGYGSPSFQNGPQIPSSQHPSAFSSTMSTPPRPPMQNLNQPPSRGSPLPPASGSSTPRETLSTCSSRNASPLPAPRYDQMEGQFQGFNYKNGDPKQFSSPVYNGSHSSSPLTLSTSQNQPQQGPIPNQTSSLPPPMMPQSTVPPPTSQPSSSFVPQGVNPSQPHPSIVPQTINPMHTPPKLPPQSAPAPQLSNMSLQTGNLPSAPSLSQPPTAVQPNFPRMPPPVQTSNLSGPMLQQQPPQQRPVAPPPFTGQQMLPNFSQPQNTGPPPMSGPPFQPKPLTQQPQSIPGYGQLPPQNQMMYSQSSTAPQPGGLTYSQPGMPMKPIQTTQPFLPNKDNTSSLGQRYPTPQAGYNQQQQQLQQQARPGVDNMTAQMGKLSVAQTGFNRLWGADSYDLMQIRNILPHDKVAPPKISLQQSIMENANCSPDIFRCTLTKIPESNSLLQKSRLPLGILIHPFKDLSVSTSTQLPVIQCNTIVRCRACRTYINPFVYFIDHRRWKCNLCYRVNDLPEEFQFDPVTKTYGDPSRRPEVKSATIEFIAPSEYMLRPPQPAVYLFVLEVSRLAVESGYLQIFCETLLEELDNLPGDSRTQIGFLTFDSSLHFYALSESYSQPRMMVVGDIDDIFLPWADNLLVNLNECRDMVKSLLSLLPEKFNGTNDTGSALGAALQASYKLMAATGGRVSVFQVSLPGIGPGGLQPRVTANAKDSTPFLNPATDFYKKLALDCSGQQIAVDLFLLNSQFADLATLSGISRFSGGCIHHFPDFNLNNTISVESLHNCFKRYLTRKIGLEAVMRVRCTRGLAIHTFHGNFFVRSTDLLSLPNVNPDAGFGMQLSIEESLSDCQSVCLQAALLYTSSKGERRIRVHTLCLPIAANINDILNSADQQCIIGLLAKMAVDRSQLSSLSDARDAFINVAVDVLSVYKTTQSATSGLLAPHSLRLLPLYISALLKHPAFRSGQNVRVDDRVYAMCQMKSLPLNLLIQSLYPDFYPLHFLSDEGAIEKDGELIPQPPRLHLSCEKLDSRGMFLLDKGDTMLIYIGRNIDPELCELLLGYPSFESIPDHLTDLPELDNPEALKLRRFITHVQSEKPYTPSLQIIREDSKYRNRFVQNLLEDRSESAFSYYEFLQHLKTQLK